MESNSNIVTEKKVGRPRKVSDVEQRPVHGLSEVQALVRSEKRLVARMWHPEATPGLIDTGDGVMAESLVGNPAYQLSSGDIVAL